MESTLSATIETRRYTDPEFVRWAYGLFGLVPADEDRKRQVIVTPYQGNYGAAGFVIAINGSPPRGTLVVEPVSGTLLGTHQGRVVRGSNDILAPTSLKRRYAEAIKWLGRWGLLD